MLFIGLSFIPMPVAVGLDGIEEQGDEGMEPFVEEGPDDVVTMTLKREASILRKELTRRWGLSQSSLFSHLLPALLFRRSGGFTGRFLHRRGWELSLLLLTLTNAGSGTSDLAFTCLAVTLWSFTKLVQSCLCKDIHPRELQHWCPSAMWDATAEQDLQSSTLVLTVPITFPQHQYTEHHFCEEGPGRARQEHKGPEAD